VHPFAASWSSRAVRVHAGTTVGHGAEVEVISADQVNEAYQRVLASDVRYRFVIDTSTLA